MIDYSSVNHMRYLNKNNPIKDEDIILMHHELAELKYMNQGLNQHEAHRKANSQYNYSLAIKLRKEKL